MNTMDTILIADDVELNRAILSQLFSDSYRIIEACDGGEALALVREHASRICVMLLDIVMPVMTGIQVLESMHAEGLLSKVPVILITAENSDDTFLTGYNLGTTDIISKPFNPDIVRRRVENTVDLYRHRLHLEEMVSVQTQALEEQARTLEEQAVVLAQQATRLKNMNNLVIDSLSTVVEFRNGESGGHIRRIRGITKVLLHALGKLDSIYAMPEDTIDIISSAAAMHDIGKIAIPDAILLKPGRLTAEEFDIMKTHTTRGCELLSSLHFTDEREYYNYCYEICRHHHERWDGRGYPDGLKGDQIPIWAQVVSIADVYDALVSDRVYKKAFPHKEAVRMIADGECGVFNPSLVRCFLEVADILLDTTAV